MKSAIKVALLVMVLIVLSAPHFGQSKNATVTGTVVGGDGKTAVAGATVRVENGRERVNTKTGGDGRYAFSGIGEGNITVTLVVDGGRSISKGPTFVVSGTETIIDFDLSKTPN